MTIERYSSEIVAERLHALINSKPRSPSIDEITALVEQVQREEEDKWSWPRCRLGDQIHATVMELIATYDAAIGATGPAADQIDAKVEELEAKLKGFEAQLPKQALVVTDMIARAEIAWFWHDHKPGLQSGEWDWSLDYEADDCQERTAADLIKAILTFAGLSKAYRLEG